MKFLLTFIAGLIFGLGLVVSGMSNPSKVLNFLDIFGAFDPSLIFVMAGAVLVTYFGYRWVWRRDAPYISGEFDKAAPTGIDRNLVIGAVVFGAGWGMVGFCPGPALTSLTVGGLSAAIFVASMLTGIVLARLFEGRGVNEKSENA